MGLDMYLTKKTYVKQWNHQTKEEKFIVTVKKGNRIYSDIDPKKISYIEEEIGYWRKANQIHKWFVDNIQDGEDDCKSYYVDLQQLNTLLDLCKKIQNASVLKKDMIANGYTLNDKGERIPELEEGLTIVNPAIAQELLPIQEGFFFGGTDYDEYYMQDITDTIEIIENILKSHNNSAEYYYRSSW